MKMIIASFDKFLVRKCNKHIQNMKSLILHKALYLTMPFYDYNEKQIVLLYFSDLDFKRNIC